MHVHVHVQGGIHYCATLNPVKTSNDAASIRIAA